jgi:hypothetical protein
MRLLVTTALPPALVRVPRDDAGALERPPHDVLRLPELRPHLAGVVGEQPAAWEGPERVLEERRELGRGSGIV